MRTGTIGLLTALAIAGPARASGTPAVVVEVAAGARDRRDLPLRVRLPAGVAGKFAACRVEPIGGGGPVPAQVRAGELAWALGAPLPAGSTRRYRLTPAPEPDPPGAGPLDLRAETGVLRLRLDGRVVLEYREAVAEPPAGIDPLYRRSGFLHPLATRSGRVVTDDFPPDHAHQHGVFFAWVDTAFEGRKVDFWNQPGRTGRVRHLDAEVGPAGPVEARFVARLRHEDLTAPGGPAPVLDETWTVVAYDIPGLVVLDLESSIRCAGPAPLQIHKYLYGGLGIRGNRAWGDPSARGAGPLDPARSGRSEFLTGEGKHRLDGNHTRPRWVDLSGEVDGRAAGIAVLDHPGNFRHPQPARLHPTMPYFSLAPAVLGGFEIAPGQTYTSRYRLVAHDGRPDPALIERLHGDYADPPATRVVGTEE